MKNPELKVFVILEENIVPGSPIIRKHIFVFVSISWLYNDNITLPLSDEMYNAQLIIEFRRPDEGYS
jgi:hypothetical protein